MAKVQDITTTSVYKDIVEQDKPDTLDEIIGIAGVVKDVINDPVTKNLENLKAKGIFDKSLMSSRLKQFKNNQAELERIDSEFGGSTYNYANSRNKKAIEQAILQYYNLDPNTKFTLGNPDMVYGDVLKNMNEKSVNSIEKLRAAKASLAVSGVDMNEIGTYLDEKHAAAFKNLQDEFKITGGDIIRNLFGTAPYNKASSQQMEDYISKQAYTKNFTEVENVNNTYRTLFNFDPTAASEFEEIIKNADLRFNVESKASGIIKETTTADEKGRKRTGTYRNVETSYTDNKGVKTVDTQKVIVDQGELIDINMETHNLMQRKLFEGPGMEEYFKKVNEGFSPKAAFDSIPRKYKKSLDERTKEALYVENFKDMQTGFEKHQELYYFTGTDNVFGGKDLETLKPEVKNWEDYSQNPQLYLEQNEGKVPPRPSYYYKNVAEWARGELDIGMAEQVPFPEDNANTSANSYILNSDLDDSREYQSFVNNPNIVARNMNDIFDGDAANKISKLESEFDNGIKTNFVKGSSVYVNPNSDFVTTEELMQIGLKDKVPDGSYKVGYDVKTDTLQLVNIDEPQITEPTEPVEQPKKLTSRGTRVLQAVNDIPVVGNITEGLLGSKLEFGEKIFLAAGGVGITYQAGKEGVKLGKNQLGKIIINDSKTKKVMADIIKERKKGKMFGYKTSRGYNNWFNKQTPIRQAAIQALNASGKSIDPTKLANNLIPKMGVIKFGKKLAGIPRAAGKFLFGSKTAAASTLLTLGLAGYNFFFEEGEDETEE